jgi:hypothetical protein
MESKSSLIICASSCYPFMKSILSSMTLKRVNSDMHELELSKINLMASLGKAKKSFLVFSLLKISGNVAWIFLRRISYRSTSYC